MGTDTDTDIDRFLFAQMKMSTESHKSCQQKREVSLSMSSGGARVGRTPAHVGRRQRLWSQREHGGAAVSHPNNR